MLTWGEATECEGYYLDTHSGDILRNVKSIPHSCENEGVWQADDHKGQPDVSRFEPLDEDVTTPLETIRQRAEARLGRPLSGRIINRQTAMQPNGVVITEESEMY
jgi:hypothetical protein